MNIENDIKKIIADMAQLKTNEINDEDLLIDIGIDSLSLVELIVRIENRVNIIFEDSDLNPEKLTMVGDLVKLALKV